MAEYVVKTGESAAAIFQKYQGQYQGLYEEFVKAIGRVKPGQRITLPTRQQLSAITAPAGIRHTAKTTAANTALLAGQIPRPGVAEIPRPFTSDGSRRRLDETPIRGVPATDLRARQFIPEGLGLPGRRVPAPTSAVGARRAPAGGRPGGFGAPGAGPQDVRLFRSARPELTPLGPLFTATARVGAAAPATGGGRGPRAAGALAGALPQREPYPRAFGVGGPDVLRGTTSGQYPQIYGAGGAGLLRGTTSGRYPQIYGEGFEIALGSAPGATSRRPPGASDTDLARQHIAGGLLGLHFRVWAGGDRRPEDLPGQINDLVAAQLPLAGREFDFVDHDYKRFLEALGYGWDPTADRGNGAWRRKEFFDTGGGGGFFGGATGRPSGGGRGGGGGRDGGGAGFGFGGEGNLVRWVI